MTSARRLPAVGANHVQAHGGGVLLPYYIYFNIYTGIY